MPALPGLPPLPDTPALEAAREIIARLKSWGHEGYLVGGCVRDWLFGLAPHDVDVATSAKPDELTALFEKTREVGARFGVIHVHFPHAIIEVATFRSEGAYADFRRPVEVRFGTLEKDANRRDFTINALYYDPLAGKLVDLHAGMLDLRRRILRTVGAARHRFEEDALRLIRAVRFAIRFELEIEINTRKALLAKGPLLAEISKERIGDELLRILTGPNPGRAMRLMSELKLWAHVIPEVEALHGVEQGPDVHPEGDVFVHTSLVLDHLPPDPPPALALAALLHDIAKPRTLTHEDGRIRFIGHQTVGAQMAREICQNLRFSNELTEHVAELIENHMRFMDVPRMKPSTLKRWIGQPHFQSHLDLHRADSLASVGDLSAYQFCIEERLKLAERHGEEMLPKALLGGDDLIALGLKPGPRFKELLDEVHDEQIEGRINTHDEALKFIRTRIG